MVTILKNKNQLVRTVYLLVETNDLINASSVIIHNISFIYFHLSLTSYGLSCSDSSLNIAPHFPSKRSYRFVQHVRNRKTEDSFCVSWRLWSADVLSVTYDVLRLIFLTFIDEGRPVERPEWLGCSFVRSRTLRTEVFSQKVLKALLARHMDRSLFTQ